MCLYLSYVFRTVLYLGNLYICMKMCVSVL